ncbi:hypothetical protein FLJC2902T_07750 [Flavobacterium limnosediminis JC2902]|uniref:Secreted protein n=1 Tax=Flavobacterium limnosediminis JC2902 TaxID=1341181 RepID=V6SRP9_9FLAO|nr:hypothetical protein [Flavobacterium limnosediminis]ESU29378.1 hypothetical protein FLJC2902T_07750 [Flavobacterium limnosediminis JC2902]
MKINKHISFVLAMLILVSNVGLAFNVHYCGGELAEISLDYKKSEPCEVKEIEKQETCCASSDEHDTCCSNSKVDLKKSLSDEVIVKSFQLDLGVFTFVEGWKAPEALINLAENNLKSDTPSFYCDSNAPPLYKLYCQYLFYDRF